MINLHNKFYNRQKNYDSNYNPKYTAFSKEPAKSQPYKKDNKKEYFVICVAKVIVIKLSDSLKHRHLKSVLVYLFHKKSQFVLKKQLKKINT